MSEMALTNVTYPGLPRQRAAGAHWWNAVVSFFTATESAPKEGDERRIPCRAPRRYAYLDESAMRRAMERL